MCTCAQSNFIGTIIFVQYTGYQIFFKQNEELHKSSNFWLKTSRKKNVLLLSHKQTVVPTI